MIKLDTGKVEWDAEIRIYFPRKMAKSTLEWEKSKALIRKKRKSETVYYDSL